MKKIILTLVVALSSLICTSCIEAKAADDNIYQNTPYVYTKSVTSHNGYRVYIIQIDGHDYIMVKHTQGGIGLCHSESCECKQK